MYYIRSFLTKKKYELFNLIWLCSLQVAQKSPCKRSTMNTPDGKSASIGSKHGAHQGAADLIAAGVNEKFVSMVESSTF